MIKKFEFLEHTADTKIRAYGSSFEEAFSNAVLSATQVMTNLDEVKKISSHKVSITSSSLKALLYDLLEEVLFLFDTQGFLVSEVKEFKIIKNNGFVLNTTLIGDIASNYEVHSGIKAITYSEMDVFESEGLFVVQLVFDL